jgi:hypothetical protein
MLLTNLFSGRRFQIKLTSNKLNYKLNCKLLNPKLISKLPNMLTLNSTALMLTKVNLTRKAVSSTTYMIEFARLLQAQFHHLLYLKWLFYLGIHSRLKPSVACNGTKATLKLNTPYLQILKLI